MQNGIASESGSFGGMYRLKPFYDSSTPIDLPTSMYHLDKVRAHSAVTSGNVVSDDAVILELEDRQDRILSRLEALRQEVDRLLAGEKSQLSKTASSCVDTLQCPATNTSPAISKVSPASLQKSNVSESSWEGLSVEHLERRLDHNLSRLENLRIQVSQLALDDLSVCNASVTRPTALVPQYTAVKPSSRTVSAASKQTLQRVGLVSNTIIDLVLCASPSSVPLSLFVLYDLLSDKFSVLPTSYVHSSTISNKAVAKVMDIFETGGVLATNRSTHQLGFTVIWKEEKRTPSLTIKTNPIVGEANIARYLARILGNGLYDDDKFNIIRTTQIDEVIDLGTAIGTKNGCTALILKRLETILGQQEWILGTRTLADIVMWSALKRSHAVGKLPQNIQRWMNACSQRPEYALANQISL